MASSQGGIMIIQAIQYPVVITTCGKAVPIDKIKGHPAPGKVLNDQYQIVGGEAAQCET
jgi:hypothetical protein